MDMYTVHPTLSERFLSRLGPVAGRQKWLQKKKIDTRISFRRSPHHNIYLVASSIKWPLSPPIHTAHQARTSSSPKHSCLKQTKKLSSNTPFPHTSLTDNQKCVSKSSSSSLSSLPSLQLLSPMLKSRETSSHEKLRRKQTRVAQTLNRLPA